MFGGGPAGSGAKVNLGPVQPIEAIRILLALFLAGYFARNWELLRAVRGERHRLHRGSAMAEPAARRGTRFRCSSGSAPPLLLFFIQRDLGPALMLSVVFLAAYAIARGTVGLVLVGAALLAAGFYLGYRLGISATLADRVRMWQSPWDNTARGGDQIAHALWALASGGTFGTGVGLGDTRYLPAGHTDLVLASVGEELGFAGLFVVGIVYASMIARALRTARRAATDYGFFLATMLALFLAVPVLLMAAGMLGVVPLTGVVTPFLSFGGSAMVANFAALGLLASIRSDPRPPADLDVFRAPVRWLAVCDGGCRSGRLSSSRRACRLRRPTRSSCGRISASRQTACGVIRTTRAFSISSGGSRAAPSSIANGLPLATDDRRGACARPRRHTRALGIALDVRRARTPASAAIRSAAAPSICSAMRRRGATGAPPTPRSSSATARRSFAASTITPSPWT